MKIFPDTSPENPVYLSCECGESLTLVEPPPQWPLPCPVCGRNVRVVDPATVGRVPELEGGKGRALLAAPGESSDLPVLREAGLPAPTGGVDLPEPYQDAGEVEIPGRSFTGRPVRRTVKVRPPEVYGPETLAMALWLAAVFAVFVGHLLLTDGDFEPGSILVRSALFAVVTVVFTAMQGFTVAPTLRLPRAPRFFFTVASLGIPLTVAMALLWFEFVDVISEGSPGASDPLEDLLRDPSTSLPLMILAIGILPGLFEELGFRGWMQSAWRHFLPPWRALILTACFFTIAHFSIIAIGWLLPMAIYLGWLREASGSIWPGVIAHMGHNTAVVLISRFA